MLTTRSLSHRNAIAKRRKINRGIVAGCVCLVVVSTLSTIIIVRGYTSPQEANSNINPEIVKIQEEYKMTRDSFLDLITTFDKGEAQKEAGLSQKIIQDIAGEITERSRQQIKDKDSPNYRANIAIPIEKAFINGADLLFKGESGIQAVLVFQDEKGNWQHLKISPAELKAIGLTKILASHQAQSLPQGKAPDIRADLVALGEKANKLRTLRAREYEIKGSPDIAQELASINQFRKDEAALKAPEIPSKNEIQKQQKKEINPPAKKELPPSKPKEQKHSSIPTEIIDEVKNSILEHGLRTM